MIGKSGTLSAPFFLVKTPVFVSFLLRFRFVLVSFRFLAFSVFTNVFKAFSFRFRFVSVSFSRCFRFVLSDKKTSLDLYVVNVFCCNIYHIHESNIYGERQCRGKL